MEVEEHRPTSESISGTVPPVPRIEPSTGSSLSSNNEQSHEHCEPARLVMHRMMRFVGFFRHGLRGTRGMRTEVHTLEANS